MQENNTARQIKDSSSEAQKETRVSVDPKDAKPEFIARLNEAWESKKQAFFVPKSFGNSSTNLGL